MIMSRLSHDFLFRQGLMDLGFRGPSYSSPGILIRLERGKTSTPFRAYLVHEGAEADRVSNRGVLYTNRARNLD